LIAQFTDIINDDELVLGNTIANFSNNRFFNDRYLRIPPTQLAPSLGAPLRGRREVYILYLKINEATPFGTLRLRLLNGAMISQSHGIEKIGTAEVSVDVERLANKPLAVNFECFRNHPNWVLQFGTENGFDFCPLVADFFALIRASAPTNDRTMALPRFITGLRQGYETLGQDLRGSAGQPYGKTIRQLRTYNVEFRRVQAESIDSYFHRVSVTEPHFVVPYPEAVAQAPPYGRPFQGRPISASAT